ncbi:hypothetical protein [Streptomyces anandii]|uniref:hypothetical protein n=1 Tax=Streptomyces anandii TaxID=285454 RepID=UPI0036C485B7
MGFFDSVNVDDIPDNPNELPNNTYKFQVISAVLDKTKNGDKTGITFKYQIIEGPWSNFFPIVDWVRVPDGNVKPDEVQRMLSYLKMRLLAFGFSIDEIQTFDNSSVSDCINRVFYGTTFLKKADDNTQIRIQKFDSLDSDPTDDDI